MKKQLFSLALWMFFGFVLVNAIDSILSFIVSVYSYSSLYLKLSLNFLYYSIPILTFILYSIPALIFIKYLNKKSVDFNLDKIKLPYVIYIIAIITTILLNPIQNYILEIFSEDFYSLNSPYEPGGIISVLQVMWSSIGICQCLSIIILPIFFYRIYKKSEIETKQ